jgi:hypothetical protein
VERVEEELDLFRGAAARRGMDPVEEPVLSDESALGHDPGLSIADLDDRCVAAVVPVHAGRGDRERSAEGVEPILEEGPGRSPSARGAARQEIAYEVVGLVASRCQEPLSKAASAPEGATTRNRSGTSY